MKFEEFLQWQGNIYTRVMGGQSLEGEVNQFLREIDISINVYARLASQLSGIQRGWTKELDTLCHLRDQITKLKEQKNGAVKKT